jgi:hypothetical protein
MSAKEAHMPWWVVEIATDVVLAALVLALGPLIKRFGKTYAGDVFRANPRTGKSYLILMDIAYYLIFSAYILFTVSFSRELGWTETVGARQLEAQTVRVGGMLLLLGILHGLNVLSLPVIGRLLGMGRLLDEDTRPKAA